jgi:hypothetical protein
LPHRKVLQWFWLRSEWLLFFNPTEFHWLHGMMYINFNMA